jgi:DNA-binding transcriptional ArsR family regulator
LARVGTALGHPLRVRIIRALIAGPGSATTLSKAFDEISLGDVYYHLNVLERCRVVELRGLQRGRGSKERFFALRRPVRWGDVWDSLPPPAVAACHNAWLGAFAGLAAAALESRTTERAGTFFSGRPFRTDEQGFQEIGEAIRAAVASIERISGESQERLELSEAAEEINVAFGAAAFEAPPANWWEARRLESPSE